MNSPFFSLSQGLFVKAELCALRQKVTASLCPIVVRFSKDLSTMLGLQHHVFLNFFFRNLFSYLRREILAMKITCSSPRISLMQTVTKCKIRVRTIHNTNGRRCTMYDAKNLQYKHVAVYGRFIRC